CDGAITPTPSDNVVPGSCPDEKTIIRTWTAKDICGNTVSKDQTIKVTDNTPPSVSCPADITLPAPIAPATCSQAVYPTINATDDCDSDVEVTFNPPQTEACFPCGSTTVVTV